MIRFLRKLAVGALIGGATVAGLGVAMEYWSRRYDPDARLDDGAGTL